MLLLWFYYVQQSEVIEQVNLYFCSPVMFVSVLQIVQYVKMGDYCSDILSNHPFKSGC